MIARSPPASNARMQPASKFSSMAPIVGSPMEWLRPPDATTAIRASPGNKAIAVASTFPHSTQRAIDGIGGSRLLMTIGTIAGNGSSSIRQSGMQNP